MSLGVDNTGSDNGCNEIGNSAKNSSSRTDNCKDDNRSASRTEFDKFQRKVTGRDVYGGKLTHSNCDLHDLFGNQKTPKAVEEEEEEVTIKSQEPLKGLRSLFSFMSNTVTKVNVPCEVTKKVLLDAKPTNNAIEQVRLEKDHADITSILNTSQTNCSVACIDEHTPDVETVRDCLDDCLEERYELTQDLRNYN